jgi:hypothetical protein
MNRHEHWTGDEELLERYVLHRMDDETRGPLDAHLAGCAQCRDAVARELRIAAGVRRTGRNALRERIAAKTGVRAAGTTPWPRIISVAALIAIVIGIGSYYRWFHSSESPTQTLTLKTEQDLAGNAVRDDAKDRSRRAPAADSATAIALADQPPESPRQKTAGAQEAARTGVAKELLAPRASAPALQDAAGGNEREDRASGYAMPMGNTGRVAYWIEGVLVGGEYQQARDKQKEHAADELSLDRKDMEKKVEEGKPVPVSAQQYNVAQRPLASLPTTQQYRQQNLAANTVQTEIERQDGTINITLFTDRRFDPDDIAHATVQQIGRDSLVVQLRSQAIGYRLPAGWR